MSNADQEEYWSSAAGQSWVEVQLEMDACLQPVLDLVLDKAALPLGARVLDVGSGTGASVLQAAQQVGPNGHVTGLDISQTMLDLAAARLQDHPNTECLKADAQSYGFEAHSFDALISRFGVMFFEDTTAAFTNIARALVPGAPLTFAAWGPASQNPYFLHAAAISTKILGPMEKVDRTLPGPFAFEDSARIIPILQAAGLQDVSVDPIALDLCPPGDPQQTAELLCQIGPANRALNHFEPNKTDSARLVEALVDWLKTYETERGIEIPAQINLYQAKAPD